MSYSEPSPGRHLERARLKAGLSLRELARRAGTSHATLSAYERGTKSPTLQTFLRIVESCGLAVEFSYSRRIREANGLSRSDELIQVLGLAEQFPVRVSRHLDGPIIAHLKRA